MSIQTMVTLIKLPPSLVFISFVKYVLKSDIACIVFSDKQPVFETIDERFKYFEDRKRVEKDFKLVKMCLTKTEATDRIVLDDHQQFISSFDTASLNMKEAIAEETVSEESRLFNSLKYQKRVDSLIR